MSENAPSFPKVTYLTAGAGGMYCGSCIRDNALVGEMQKLGWDITLLPLYTPIRTDDENRSMDRVFFGGVNVYLQQKIPLFRHLPGFFDRWLDNPAFIKRVASGNMSVDAKQLGALTLSMVKGEDGNQKREVQKLVKWLKEHEKPELLCLTNLLVGGAIPALKRELDIPILVTLQGDDVFLDELEEPWHSKVLDQMKKLAAMADGFITFSGHYRDEMADLLSISPEKFHLAPIGVDAHHFREIYDSKSEQENETKTLGYFARLCPEKGFDLAVSAFIKLAEEDQNLTFIAGGWLSAKDETFFAEQIKRMEQAGLEGRFAIHKSPDEAGKREILSKTDVFCVPARFLEPKGIYALEAMACGIPVVLPDRGVFPEWIEDSSPFGRLFRSGDVDDLAEKIEAAFELDGSHGVNWVTTKGDRKRMAEVTAGIFRQFL